MQPFFRELNLSVLHCIKEWFAWEPYGKAMPNLRKLEKLMKNAFSKPRRTYYKAFIRDKYCCVYCGKNILESFDSFASSHLNRLKPESAQNHYESVLSRVTACSVCNFLKGAFDPLPGEHVTEENFTAAVAKAQDYIQKKRREVLTELQS